MRFIRIFWKLKYFSMTSYPLKMTSYHSQILLIPRFWVGLFEKTVVVGIQPTSCLLNFHTCTLLFVFKLEKTLQSKSESINQTLFSTKSTTLNQMVKSDLVTYRGVTMPNLFLQATISVYFSTWCLLILSGLFGKWAIITEVPWPMGHMICIQAR